MGRRQRSSDSNSAQARLFRQAERNQSRRAEHGVAEAGYGRGRLLKDAGITLAIGLVAGALTLLTAYWKGRALPARRLTGQ